MIRYSTAVRSRLRISVNTHYNGLMISNIPTVSSTVVFHFIAHRTATKKASRSSSASVMASVLDNDSLVCNNTVNNSLDKSHSAPVRRRTRSKFTPSSSFVTVQNMDQDQLQTAKDTISLIQSETTLTPLMQEISDLQKHNPEHILLVQVGSFYEIYDIGGYLDEIAGLLSLRIATMKGKRDPVRMAGFPMHCYKDYVTSLINNGKTVALVQQVGKDYSISSKSFVRAVTRIITPGTMIDDNMASDVAENSFLLSIVSPVVVSSLQKSKIGLAWMDVSTGEFFTAQSNLQSLETDLARIQPREILVQEHMQSAINYIPALKSAAHLTFKPDSLFTDPKSIGRFRNLVLRSDLGLANHDGSDEAVFKGYSPYQTQAAAGMLEYVAHNLPLAEHAFRLPISQNKKQMMKLDKVTLKSLEILRNIRDGGIRGSLFQAVNYTKTNAGSRLLISRLSSPLVDIEEINHIHDVVEAFTKQPSHWIHDITLPLETCCDIKKNLQRLSLGNGSLTDFRDIIDTLRNSATIRNILTSEIPQKCNGTVLFDLGNSISDFSALYDKLEGVLNDGINGNITLGSISKGVSKHLDTLRENRTELNQKRQQLFTKLVQVYGENFSFIVDNRYGAALEFPKINSKKRPKLLNIIDMDPASTLMHEQRLASGVRIHNKHWTDLLNQMQELDDEMLKLEIDIFEKACNQIKQSIPELIELSRILSEIDVSLSFAVLSIEKEYVRPKMVTEPIHKITGSRHPVVENFQQLRGSMFIKNDIDLSEDQRMWILTGPNMGGKSTFLRQCALLSILAQAGGFVPADSATLGVVDGIYTRIGASDDLSANESTFMVEMRETAYILANATPSSLVIMDEVGRGTSMLDGLSLAYGIIEHLANVNQSRGLFATHYHELATFTHMMNITGIGEYHATCQLDKDNGLICLYRIEPGIMNQSHGIEVASHAGLPSEVIRIAKEMYTNLETQIK
ncbi:MutS protein 1 [Batrachochytrium dendrobatidis]